MSEPAWKTAIREALVEKQTNMKQASLKAGLGETFVRDMLARERTPTLEKFTKICEVLDINPSVMFGVHAMNEGTRTLQVKGHVQAGAWEESAIWPEEAWFDISIPDTMKGITLHAAQSRGTSMNKSFPEGTIFIYDDVWETGEAPTPGNLYIVERIRSDGLYETTVKRLFQDSEGRNLLMPESNDPNHQLPIQINGDHLVFALMSPY